MSRHRNIRARTFSEECDDYDYDQYGRSVEEDLCISPGTANMYLYENQLHNFNENFAQKQHKNDEDELTSAKLDSCIEFIRDTVGNTRTEEEILSALKDANCDPELALDILLKTSKQNEKQSIISVVNMHNSKLFTALAADPFAKSSTTKNNDFNHFKIRKFLKNFMLKSLETYNKRQTSLRGTPLTAKKPNSGTSSTTEKDKKTVEHEPLKKNSVTSKTALETPEKPSSSSSIPPSPMISKISRQNIKQKSIEEIQKLYQAKRVDGKKMLLNLVIAGHVDAGKSTIMGHLLALLGNVSKKHMHKNETEAKKVGKASFMYAWVLDETDEERNRGITIDVGHHCFETSERIINILDAPGHRDFIPNMIMGTTKADVAILVIDATNGEFESGFEAGGQTQEHILLLRSFGISQVAVVINKMDNVNFEQARYQEIVDKMKKFLKQVGFKDKSIQYIPCSGMTGDNLIELSKSPNFNWYKGPSVIDVINNFSCSPRHIEKPFRMSISDFFKGQTSGIYLSGKIDNGYVEQNQKLLIMPINEYCTVKSILIDDQIQNEAFAGDFCYLNITHIDGLEISIGNVLCDALSPCTLATKFEARIVTFSTIGVPIINGTSVMIYSVCLNEVVTITKLCAQLEKNKNDIIKRNPRLLGKNQSAIVQITASRPICIETFENNKEYGRFVIRSEHFTMGTGIVTKILDKVN